MARQAHFGIFQKNLKYMPCVVFGEEQTFFLSKKYPVYGPLGIKVFRTLKTILLCVFSYLHVSAPFLFVHAEP